MVDMKLIIQGPQAAWHAAHRVADIAKAHTVKQISEHVFRCDGVHSDEETRDAVRGACLGAGVDGAFVPVDLLLERFRVLVMDMDSTLITIECIDEIADMQGLKSEVAEITEAAMRGELDFRDSLLKRVALLEGLDASALDRVFEQRLKLSRGAKVLLEAMKNAGLRTVLVSGGFTYFTERLQQSLPLDLTRANVLEISKGKLTGRVKGEIIDAQAKRHTVEQECAALGVSTAAAIVIGDGANDLEMMAVAGLSVAYRAKPVVQQKASVALNFSGLDGLLNLFH
ncbi:MAG: phosphoserine phosphatase SerB [Pseudomonadota bacterium]|jgi:phosphoserine phosphatase